MKFSLFVAISRGFVVDIDECELSEGVCSVNGDCANEVGGFDCSCCYGFVGDGFTCGECCQRVCVDQMLLCIAY